MNSLVFFQSAGACPLTGFPESISSWVQAAARYRALDFFRNGSAACAAVNSDMFSVEHGARLLFQKIGKSSMTERDFLSKITFGINNCFFNSRSLAVVVQGYLGHFLSMCYTD